jgi:hypothetical protein
MIRLRSLGAFDRMNVGSCDGPGTFSPVAATGCTGAAAGFPVAATGFPVAGAGDRRTGLLSRGGKVPVDEGSSAVVVESVSWLFMVGNAVLVLLCTGVCMNSVGRCVGGFGGGDGNSLGRAIIGAGDGRLVGDLLVGSMVGGKVVGDADGDELGDDDFFIFFGGRVVFSSFTDGVDDGPPLLICTGVCTNSVGRFVGGVGVGNGFGRTFIGAGDGKLVGDLLVGSMVGGEVVGNADGDEVVLSSSTSEQAQGI